MKKIILLFMFFVTVSLTAQRMAFSVVEFKAKPHTQKDILKAFTDTYEGVKMNQAGIVLERMGNGRTKGATHRLVFMWTLGVKMMAKDAISDDKSSVLWSKMRNFVEEWGTEYSGRILSWQEGDTDKNSNVHIWDVKIDDPNLFKAGHDKIVEKYKEDFLGRVVGFGTYDIGRPNGASHWVALSGENKNDHMMLYDKLQKDAKFIQLIQERGPVEDVKDYEIKILKRFQ